MKFRVWTRPTSPKPISPTPIRSGATSGTRLCQRSTFTCGTSASAEAMEDLKRILAGRSAFYAKADLRFNTSDYDSEEAAFRALRQSVREATGIKA